ncbi:MAG TPA: hypothetical protein VFZ79_03375 [Acidimicrobiales bacterium]
MRPPAKLAVYGAVLAIALVGGAGAGAALGPIDVSADDTHEPRPADGTPAADSAHDGGHDGEAAGGDGAAGADLPPGLAVAQGGYRLDVEDVTLAGGDPADLRFRVLDDTGATVTGFEVEHEKRLHLVVVGRNLVDYAHLHPTRGEDGTWVARLPSLPPGSYRAFADFRPAGGEALTLGVDLTVAGNRPATEVPAPADRATVDGYEVTVDGEARVGESELAFTVEQDGDAVRTEPYLGAAGHLVAIRAGDLAYTHVHPLDGDGNEVRFAAEFPTPGTYRLFLDFAHGGEVRTAAYTVEVHDGTTEEPAGDAPTTSPPAAGDDDERH